MSTHQSQNDAGQSPDSGTKDNKMAGDFETSKSLVLGAPQVPYDRNAHVATVVQMLTNRPSISTELDHLEDISTSGSYTRGYWKSEIDGFPQLLGQAAARAVNKGNGTASVWRAGWRDDLGKPLRTRAFRDTSRPFSDLPAKVQEKIKARGDRVIGLAADEQEPRYEKLTPPFPLPLGDGIVREDDDRIVWMRVSPNQKIANTHEATCTADASEDPSAESKNWPSNPPEVLLPRLINPDDFTNNNIPRDWEDDIPKHPGTPYPIRTRPAHRKDQQPPGFPGGPGLGRFHKTHSHSSSMEVNVPRPARMSAHEIRELVGKKIDMLREEVASQFELERELVRMRIAESRQEGSNVMELEIKLKMSEEEKEVYKREICKLQAKVRELEGRE